MKIEVGQIWKVTNLFDKRDLGNFIKIIRICNGEISYKYENSIKEFSRYESFFIENFIYDKKYNTKLYKVLNS